MIVKLSIRIKSEYHSREEIMHLYHGISLGNRGIGFSWGDYEPAIYVQTRIFLYLSDKFQRTLKRCGNIRVEEMQHG